MDDLLVGGYCSIILRPLESRYDISIRRRQDIIAMPPDFHHAQCMSCTSTFIGPPIQLSAFLHQVPLGAMCEGGRSVGRSVTKWLCLKCIRAKQFLWLKDSL